MASYQEGFEQARFITTDYSQFGILLSGRGDKDRGCPLLVPGGPVTYNEC